jgi:hypothetical protein
MVDQSFYYSEDISLSLSTRKWAKWVVAMKDNSIVVAILCHNRVWAHLPSNHCPKYYLCNNSSKYFTAVITGRC